MASHDMNGTGDSTNIVTIDASDEGLSQELELVVLLTYRERFSMLFSSSSCFGESYASA